ASRPRRTGTARRQSGGRDRRPAPSPAAAARPARNPCFRSQAERPAAAGHSGRADADALPSLRRDIAIEVDEGVKWAQIAATLRSGLPTMLNEVVLFDCFRGPGLSAGRKSLAIG